MSGKIQRTVYFDPEIWEIINTMAKTSRRKFSEQLNFMVEHYSEMLKEIKPSVYSGDQR